MGHAGWYGVRCLFDWAQVGGTYEERVTLWRAASFEEAIAKAEAEAHDHAELLGMHYLGLAQAYFIGDDESITEGAEVFSLLRDSDLDPDDYLNQFFDTGDERQSGIPPDAS